MYVDVCIEIQALWMRNLRTREVAIQVSLVFDNPSGTGAQGTTIG